MDNKRKGGLGRGLSAILSSDIKQEIEKEVDVANSVNLISIGQIETNPFQPRTEFDVEALEELAASIKVHGIIQPITVRKLANKQYQLISGERRWRASKIAGLTELPAYIRTADDEQMIEMALIENIQRQDLNPIEIALSYKRMIEELGLKQEDLGDKVGKKRATVSNFIRLLKLPPEIQIALRDGRLSMGHAKPLISLDNAITQLAVFQQIIADDLNVRKVEELIRKMGKPKAEKKVTAQEPTTDEILIRDIERKLEDRFGNQTTIVQGPNGKGEIRLVYHSTDDLNRILEMLEV